MGEGARKRRNVERKGQKKVPKGSTPEAPSRPAAPLEDHDMPPQLPKGSLAEQKDKNASSSTTDKAKNTKSKKNLALAATGRSSRSRAVPLAQSLGADTQGQPSSVRTIEAVQEPIKTPDARPRRKATAGFENVLAEIVEELGHEDHEERVADDDKAVGGYKWGPGEYENWAKRWNSGPDEREDDFESDDSLYGEFDWDSVGGPAQIVPVASSVSKRGEAKSRTSQKAAGIKPKKATSSKKRNREPESFDISSDSDTGKWACVLKIDHLLFYFL